jgi:hypothetical protein
MFGELTQRHEQSFGFVNAPSGERVFVPPNLMKGLALPANSEVVCKAIMGKDKTGKVGWRALTIQTNAPQLIV